MTSFNEIQKKWLQGYLAEEYSLEQLKARLLSKERERRKQLQELLLYIDEPGCRRHFIQKYFADEEQGEPPLACCDRCGLSFDNYQEQSVQSPQEAQRSENWRLILLRLFKE